ncbi:MAG: hypothetical protein ACJA1E_000344 [Paracoccaceae bacterium]|jgi:hypothetical protein
MMTHDKTTRPDDDMPDDEMLDGFFEAARQQQPQIPEEVVARILADADREQAHHLKGVVTPVRSTRNFFGDVMAALGGWPSLAGLAAATLAGVWIGYSPPTSLDSIALLVLGGETISFGGFDIMTSDDTLFALEG